MLQIGFVLKLLRNHGMLIVQLSTVAYRLTGIIGPYLL